MFMALFMCMLDSRLSVIGFVCNGEFNYLRSKGYTRPVSVLQIRSQVRKKYSKMRQDTMIAMLSPRSKAILCIS